MSAATTPLLSEERPTHIRHWVVAVTTLMAVLLYLDRLCVGIASEYIREDLRMTQTQMSWFLSAFFWSYALAQVPAGLLSDRLGARWMLTIYILAWSAFTGLLGFAHQVSMVLQLRFLCGVSQAGAYPTAGGLIRVWYPISGRGTANSIVALGGRAGGVLAPILTAWFISSYSASHDPAAFDESEIIDHQAFLQAFLSDKESAKILTKRFVARLPEHVQRTLEVDLRHELDLIPAPRACPKVFGIEFDWQDWTPAVEHPATTYLESYKELLKHIQASLTDPDLFDGLDLTELKLAREGAALVGRRTSSRSLSNDEATMLNRLVLEAGFPGAIKRHRGAGWRSTMFVYGLFGIAVASIFFVVVRDTPSQHPSCNAAEHHLIEEDSSNPSPVQSPPFPLGPMLTNLSLWGNSFMQIFTNIGWVFVVTWLPRYLDKVHRIPLEGQAIMTAIPTAAGIFGMYAGGWWTDLATRRYGKKWGRRLPAVVTRFTAAAGYGICLLLSLNYAPNPDLKWIPWAYVAALSLMVFSVDMGNPAVWAYSQDVGGKYTGSILGWANMWGNFGAALAPPLIYNRILGEEPTIADWNTMFGVCLLAFVLSGLCGFVLDSSKSLVTNDQRPMINDQ